jgi:nitrogen fixation/metabolism regulation signal transduction histidine kinase
MTDINPVILTAVLDNLPLGVALIDAEGRVRYTNARLAALVDQPAHDWVGQRWDDRMARAGLGGDPATLDDIRVGERILSHRREPLADGTRLEIIEDITFDRARADQLRTLFVVWDESMAHAAHELRNPLTAI